MVFSLKKKSGILKKVTDAISMNTKYKSIFLAWGIWQLVREIRPLGHSIGNYLEVIYAHLTRYAETNPRCSKKFNILKIKLKKVKIITYQTSDK